MITNSGVGNRVSHEAIDFLIGINNCESSGDRDSSNGVETHLMIYNSACATSGPWFNSTLGSCRGVIFAP